MEQPSLQQPQQLPQQAAQPHLPQHPKAAQQELQLADIHLPQKPAAWPPAWGWWVLLALMVALGSLLVLKYRHYQKRKQQRQQVLQALDKLSQRLQNERNTAALGELNILLRRLALMHFPRQKVASLTGQQWLAFLDKSGNSRDFTQGAGRILADAPYLAEVPESADINALIKVVKKWVKQMAGKDRGGSI